jgi:hypothetical protein
MVLMVICVCFCISVGFFRHRQRNVVPKVATFYLARFDYLLKSNLACHLDNTATSELRSLEDSPKDIQYKIALQEISPNTITAIQVIFGQSS